MLAEQPLADLTLETASSHASNLPDTKGLNIFLSQLIPPFYPVPKEGKNKKINSRKFYVFGSMKSLQRDIVTGMKTLI